jgi:hypothetical protein
MLFPLVCEPLESGGTDSDSDGHSDDDDDG